MATRAWHRWLAGPWACLVLALLSPLGPGGLGTRASSGQLELERRLAALEDGERRHAPPLAPRATEALAETAEVSGQPWETPHPDALNAELDGIATGVVRIGATPRALAPRPDETARGTRALPIERQARAPPRA